MPSLRQRVHAMIDELLDALDARPMGDDYASTGPLPPSTSRRTMIEWCRSGRVSGARREGRTWRCSRAAWHASRAKSAPPKLELVPPEKTAEEIADERIRAAGYRFVNRP